MFARLRCHFCGKRSQHSRGVTEFQCTGCEALNYYDRNGEVVDTPYVVANKPPLRHAPITRSMSRAGSAQPEDSQRETVCQRCLNNQRMYMEALNNYLPDDLDDDDPKMQEFMRRLPEMKAGLAKKYPQVCKACAPQVQHRIHQADYDGMSKFAESNVKKTRARQGRSAVGERDDWKKWRMRFLLRIIGLAAYANLLLQATWHAYGAFMAMCAMTVRGDSLITDYEDEAMVVEPTLQRCFDQSRMLHFEPKCHVQLGSRVSYALVASTLLLGYHPGLKLWYHKTWRMESADGRKEHFRIQVLMLVVRFVAWTYLMNPGVIAELSNQQLVAAHGFMVVFLLLAQRISERQITSKRWTIRGKIMPEPTVQDVFGSTAGPAVEQYERQASSKNPFKLFAGNDKPFQINSLAPRQQPSRPSNFGLPSMAPPSPPDTQSDSEDEDAMDIDSKPLTRTAGMPGLPVDRTFKPKMSSSSRPQSREIRNHGQTQLSGWGAMHHEVFGMQDQLREEEDRRSQEVEERSRLRFQPPVEQSPFRGRLPQAPMSMERKLRNPPTQLAFKETPVSKRQDFLAQMKSSFEKGKAFGPKGSGASSTAATSAEVYYEEDEDLSPAKSRTRGNLDLKPSSWHLPGDVVTTGLEDLLSGGSFSIADRPEAPVPTAATPTANTWHWTWMAVALVPVTILMIGWNITALRRPLCLWLVRQIDDMGL